MRFSDDIDHAYREAEVASDIPVPEGQYRLKPTGAAAQFARTGSEGIRLEFAVVDGPYAGTLLSHTFWLSGGALPYAKRILPICGFEGLSPNQILEFRDFDSLPVVRAHARRDVWQGHVRLVLEDFHADSSAGAENGDDTTATNDAPSASRGQHGA